MARAIVASKADEGQEVARYFVSPLVLRSLADRLASYKPPVHTEPPRGRVGKYGIDPSAGAPAVEEEVEAPPPPTDTQDLVIKLLACLMVHPTQGQRARLVLRDELPESLYMSLHHAGAVPADIKGDTVIALPPLPDRDSDNKLYPRRGNPNAGSSRTVLATGNATTPEPLAVPLNIVITPPDEFEMEPPGEEEEEDDAVAASAARSGTGTERMSLKRQVMVALSPNPRASEVSGGSSQMPSLISGSLTSTPLSHNSGKGKGLWQRASTNWSSSTPNTPGTTEVSDESRAATLPSPQLSAAGSRGRSVSMKRIGLGVKTTPASGDPADRASSVSPKSPRSPGRKAAINWAAVGRALSPGVVRPPEGGES